MNATFNAIPGGIFNRLLKLTSSIEEESIMKIYKLVIKDIKK